MKEKIYILIRICIIAGIFVFPWWVILIASLAALFLYDNYYDILLIGFICDVIYHSKGTFFGLYGFTLISCVLFVLVKQIKKRLILY